MTGKDKTEDQLLSSIRKNKPAADPVPRKAAVKKAPPRKATATPSRPKTTSESAARSAYKSGRRVWPD